MVQKEILPQAFLIIYGTKVYPIEKLITKIGRSFENDLILQYPQISRRHAEIRIKDGNFVIVDMDSTGGTFVNGIKVWQQTLHKGDVITLVNLHLVFDLDRSHDLATFSLYQNPKNRFGVDKETKTLVNVQSE